MVRLSASKVLMICLTAIAIAGMHIFFQCRHVSRHTDLVEKNIPKTIKTPASKSKSEKEVSSKSPEENWGPHKLAVIIPFRERFEELLEFAPWIHTFLNNQKVRHKIFVVNQVDTHRFNRAALINIGFLKSKEECDYMVMHDVDLLPNNPDLKYTFPTQGVHHLASPDIHPIYHYPKYVGGVLMLQSKDFELCRGMSNIFWGWGREDDEFYMRMKGNNLPLLRPKGITTGYNTFKHIHDKVKRPRDYKRYGSQKQVQFKRDPKTGYDTLEYKIVLQKEMEIDGAPLTVFNVELHCNVNETPWCDHSKG